MYNHRMIRGWLWAAALLFVRSGLPAQEPAEPEKKTVSVPLKGLVASSCYVTVEKALRKRPEIQAVTHWIDQKNYHIHACVTAPLRLSSIQPALEAAMREMKETMNMQVAYHVDETKAVVAPDATVVFTGPEEVIGALEAIVAVETFEARDDDWELRIAVPEPLSLTVAELRRAVEQAGGKLTDTTLKATHPPPPAYVCPAGCSASAAPAICPKCAQELVKSAEGSEPDGGC